MKLVVELPIDCLPGLRRAFEHLPGAEVREQDVDGITLIGPSGREVTFHMLGAGDLDTMSDVVSVLPDRQPRRQGTLPLVYGARLSRGLRGQLREAGISYADGTGHIGVFAGDVCVVLDEPPRSRRRTGGAAGASLGHVGVRAVQFMVDRPREAWTTTALAELASVSVGQAHKVLQILEDERLIRNAGEGRRASRKLVDREAVLDWLGIHRLTVHPTEPYAMGYVPARDAQGVGAYLADAEAEHAWALSGAAAAQCYGVPVATRVPITLVRVSTPVRRGVSAAMRELGIEETDDGANVRVVRDTGEVGTADRRTINNVSVAPPSRTYLDMFSEARGSDAAELFKPTVMELGNG